MFENTYEALGLHQSDIGSFAKVYTYPDGSADIISCSAPVFHMGGWEEQKPEGRRPEGKKKEEQSERKPDEQQRDLDRSMRRARAQLRRLALANEFRWFVTLTLNQEMVDRMDGHAVVKKLNVWCSNMVQRRGLKYILVPERHKKGGIHFHGFFNDAVEAVPSGHADKQGHPIYNLPDWNLGFTTAIELYGTYSSAVGYVCKYIGKQGEKPAGRWYYSGGGLNMPCVDYVNINPREISEQYGSRAWQLSVAGKCFAGVNGVQNEDGCEFRGFEYCIQTDV